MKSSMNEEGSLAAKKNLILDLSAHSGALKSSKIQDYEAMASSSDMQSSSSRKKHPKSYTKKRSNFSEFNKLIQERQNIESKIAQIREQEKSLFEPEESIPLPNAMISNPNTSGGAPDKPQQDDEIQFDDEGEEDTALDDMD